MKYLIALDDGHGIDTAGKRTPCFEDESYMIENEFNNSVVNKIYNLLKTYKEIDVFLIKSEKYDVPLNERIKRVNTAYDNYYKKFPSSKSVLISVHANALNGIWGTQNGTSTHYYPTNMADKAFSEIINKNLVAKTGLRNRGNIGSDFQIIRDCKMTACLCECAFMDNLKEAKLLLTDEFRQACAEGIVNGLLEYFGINKIENNEQNSEEENGGNFSETAIKNKITYSETPNGTRQIFLPPEKLNIDVYPSLKNNNTFKYKYAINATFFGGNPVYSTSPLIVDGKIYRWSSNYDKPQSCFIIYKDNSVDMKRLKSVSDLENKLYSVRHLIGGIGLIDKRDKNFKYDLAGEGFDGSIGIGVSRKCNKTVLAYIKKTNQIVFLTRPNIYHSHPQKYDLIKLCKDCEFTFAVALDGSGSTFMIADEEYKLKGDGRGIYSVLFCE